MAWKHVNPFEILHNSKHITIIVISANVYENHRKSCIEAGADGFLEKPLRLEDLLNILERHISLQAEKEPCFSIDCRS